MEFRVTVWEEKDRIFASIEEIFDSASTMLAWYCWAHMEISDLASGSRRDLVLWGV